MNKKYVFYVARPDWPGAEKTEATIKKYQDKYKSFFDDSDNVIYLSCEGHNSRIELLEDNMPKTINHYHTYNSLGIVSSASLQQPYYPNWNTTGAGVCSSDMSNSESQ